MPWYAWLLLGVGVFAAVLAVTFRALRASDRGRRFLALPTRGKLRFLKALIRDPGVPWLAKAGLFAVVGYLLLPIDLIPDFIPVLGQADDVLVVLLAVALLILLIPRDRFEAALLHAAEPAPERSAAEARGRPTP